mmetsp:Transcript_22057/g.39102  ORF Transcript_22057/g.39102 Transcript_22057/m.39102 type:complete len:259 (+) Transcript_22057:383-1159(+)
MELTYDATLYTVILEHLATCPNIEVCSDFKFCSTYRALVTHSKSCPPHSCGNPECPIIQMVAHSLACEKALCSDVKGCNEWRITQRDTLGDCHICNPKDLILELFEVFHLTQANIRKLSSGQSAGPSHDAKLGPLKLEQFHAICVKHALRCPVPRAEKCHVLSQCSGFKIALEHAQGCMDESCKSAECRHCKVALRHILECGYSEPEGASYLALRSDVALRLLRDVEVHWEMENSFQHMMMEQNYGQVPAFSRMGGMN